MHTVHFLACIAVLSTCMMAAVGFRHHSVKYNNTVLPFGNRTQLSVIDAPDVIHVFALGNKGAILHKYMVKVSAQQQHAVAPRTRAARTRSRRARSRQSAVSTIITDKWSDWKVVATAPAGTYWDTDPVAGLSTDGHIDVFMREHANQDTWQFYQTNATDPNAWSAPRECANVDHSAAPNATFWNTQCSFPTSDLTIQNSPEDGTLELFFRGFDGKLFMCKELHNASMYSPPIQYDSAIFE